MELFWAVPYFGGAVAVHALLTRLPWGNPIVKFLLGGGAGGLGLSGHLISLTGLSRATLGGLLVYAFACELYLFLFTLVASSVSARLLLLLRERELGVPEIQALYQPTGMVARRINRLIAAGLLVRAGDGYRVTARGRRVAATFQAGKRFFRHPLESTRTAA
jgi:hypothetical protein